MHRAPAETRKTPSRASDGVTEDWSAVDDWHAVARSKVGQTLGGYELCELLGVGGMGAVFRARRRGQPAVALKLLRPDLAMTARGRSRFRREASAANRVGHPGAVRVLDDGEHEQAVYLVLELLEGKTVARLAREHGGTLPADQVRQIGIDVLDVLAAAHDRGMIHRDIKPDNIFITNAGRVKVLDFGLSVQSDLAHDSHVTASGATLGTPGYMAPEQAAGHRARVGPRSDLWALGATLFRLLSGRSVHLAGNAAEALIAAATRVAPRITSVVPDVPADLAHTVDRALAFELGARWQDARCMQRALESREAHPEDGEPFETTLGDSRSCASGPPQAPSVETAVARSGPQRSDGKIADARAPAAHDSWPLAGIGLSLLVVLALAAGGFAWRAIREHADDPRDVAGALAKSAIPSAEPGPQATASARVKRSQGEPRAAPPEVPAPRGEEAAPAPRRTVRSPDPSPRTARASRPQEAAPRIQESDSDRTRRLLSEREPKVSWRRHSRSALHQRGELSTPPNGSSLRR